MCTSPLHIRNRASLLGFGQKAWMNVPCGHCQECIAQKQEEYANRAYSEYRKANFVYFETLTYSDQYIPKIQFADGTSEYCFDRKDLKDFFKRLRKNLSSLGYDVKDKLRYFLCGEYGHNTQRPHYHILFFSSVPLLNLDELYFAIRGGRVYSQKKKEFVDVPGAWFKGYNNKVYNRRKFLVSSFASAKYVCKYVCKDQYTLDKIRERHPEFDDKTWKSISKPFKTFHLQSLGFGLDMLRDFSLDDYITRGGILAFDPGKLKKFIPLPQYHKRKLFYEQVKDNFSKSGFHWELTKFGSEALIKRLAYQVDNCVNRLKTLSDNYYHFNKSLDEDEKFEFEHFKFDFKELAVYQTLVREVVLPIDFRPENGFDDIIISRFHYGNIPNGYAYNYVNELNQNIAKENIDKLRFRYVPFELILSLFDKLDAERCSQKEEYDNYQHELYYKLHKFKL